MAGASPDFSETHIIRVILLLEKEASGRKKIVKSLGLGEGSARTILKHLIKNGSAVSTKKGHVLTEKGEKIVKKYLSEVSPPFKISLKDLTLYDCSAVVVHNAFDGTDTIKKSVDYRDIAVREGCLGAFFFVFSGRRLDFTTEEVKISDFPESEKILKKLSLSEKDLVVVCFAKEYNLAENGCIAVAMYIKDLKPEDLLSEQAS